MENSKILLVDDEQAILQMLEMVLKKENFTNICMAMNGKDALQMIKEETPDFIVLDVMLPDTNGFDLCVEIRKHTDAHILFLTAKVSDMDVLTGFSRGGDDYVTKPFNPLEIVARIKAHLKRKEMGNTNPINLNKRIHQFGNVLVDEDAGELYVNDVLTPCPAQVFLLLVHFCHNSNRVLSKEQLFTAVWGYDHMADDNTVMVHIRRLRERIEADPSKPTHLITVRGLGYKLIKDLAQ